MWFVQPKIWESILCCPISCCMSPTTFGCHWVIYFFGTYVMYRQIHTHLCIRYGVQTSIYIYETYFLQNGLPRSNQILTQLRFIHNWVRWDIQWMVNWSVLVHCDSCGYLSKMSLKKKKQTLENSSSSPHWILGSFISSSESMPRGRANLHSRELGPLRNYIYTYINKRLHFKLVF